MRRITALIVLLGFGLAGCGGTTEDRAASGAGIGAAGGAILGAVTGMSVLQGAVLGAAAGGLTGALTDKNSVNLGEPIWKKGETKASATDVMTIQNGLIALGYAPGPADGVAGAKTKSAIRSYQGDRKLLVDGEPSPALARHVETAVAERRN